jgi:hypothetical protein
MRLRTEKFHLWRQFALIILPRVLNFQVFSTWKFFANITCYSLHKRLWVNFFCHLTARQSSLLAKYVRNANSHFSLMWKGRGLSCRVTSDGLSSHLQLLPSLLLYMQRYIQYILCFNMLTPSGFYHVNSSWKRLKTPYCRTDIFVVVFRVSHEVSAKLPVITHWLILSGKYYIKMDGNLDRYIVMMAGKKSETQRVARIEWNYLVEKNEPSTYKWYSTRV